MADEDSTFTKEHWKSFLSLMDRVISETDKIMSGIEVSLINPNTRFATMLKAKYDALVAAGFSEKMAFELTLKTVEETLRRATAQKEETL